MALNDSWSSKLQSEVWIIFCDHGKIAAAQFLKYRQFQYITNVLGSGWKIAVFNLVLYHSVFLLWIGGAVMQQPKQIVGRLVL